MPEKIGELKSLVADKLFETWYNNYAGEVCSNFLIELRDNKRILGIKCPDCNQVIVPARPVCVRCFKKTENWIEVSNIGELLTYTYSYTSNQTIIFGIILLDGADTGLLHLLGEIDPKNVKIGMRFQAVFNDVRIGDINDIKHFKPV
ncbi:Zn-ribbon domain-containing OB-fold protein [Thermodesulfobacteriota bacterium]